MSTTRQIAQGLLDTLRRRHEDHVGLLARMVEVESPSQDAESHQAIFELLAERLSAMRFDVQIRRGECTGGTLLARRGDASQRGSLLLGHSDTVWPAGTLTSMPVERTEDRLYGPGVYDMKAGLVQIVAALAALDELGQTPTAPTTILINADEEIGSPESTGQIEELARASQEVFVLEPSLGPEGRLKTSRKGVGRFWVHVRGRAAHAGLDPDEGISAILELSYLVQQLFALNDPLRGITVNVGKIDGGLRPNVVAPESSAVIDVRVPTAEDARWVEEQIRSLRPRNPHVELTVDGRMGRPPMPRTEEISHLWRRAERGAALLGFELAEGAAGGGSDANTASQFAPTLDGLGAVGDGAHANHEHILLSSLVERSALLAMLLVHS